MNNPNMVATYKFTVAEQDQVFSFSLAEQDQTFVFGSTSAIELLQGETYAGPYVVTPRPYDSVELETRDKLMADNVVVLKVPYYETSNIYDGKTVFIAEDINNG